MHTRCNVRLFSKEKGKEGARSQVMSHLMSLVSDIVNLSFQWHIKVELTWSSRKRLGVKI